ncbi:MAG: V-type ATP synthase subunit I [Cyclobacteriaceae bacterium]|nr:V-type ATP synthase subunit I [Cyclobacteriaceae bacterium]
MKEKMKKLTLLLFHQEKDQVLSKLQELGVVHLEAEIPEGHQDIDALLEKQSDIQKALEVLKSASAVSSISAQSDKDAEALLKRVLDLNEQTEQLEHKLEVLRKEEESLAVWGEFSWEKIQRLEKIGIQTSFYTSGKREFENFDFGDQVATMISQTKTQVYFVVFSRNGAGDLPFELILLPETSLSSIIDKRREYLRELESLQNEIKAVAVHRSLLKKHLLLTNDQLERMVADTSLQAIAEGKILKINGWFPSSIENRVTGFLNEEKIAYDVNLPEKDDKIPVILKNKKYPKVFESITKIFQLPDYYEFDLTPMIAVFYPLFFAYCLGDSGYGLIFVVVAGIGYFTYMREMRNIALLGVILGIVTMLMGIVNSGVIFGMKILELKELTFFSFLSDFVFLTDDETIFNPFNVALMIGLVQIFTGVIIFTWKRWVYDGFIYSLYGFGKFFLMFGTIVIFLGAMQEVAFFVPFTSAGGAMMILGVLMVLAFHDPDQPFLSRVGGGVLPLYFILTGLMGDSLSYIRLFALGVASSILGLVVNQIGMQMMEGAGIIGIVGAVLFLIAGHGLNLALASLGAFVHPLRLTFVEFYNNAGFKGGGIPYKPFRKEALIDN